MAKTLILLRHAKSREAEKGQKDFERTLTESGIRDASITGRFLYNQNFSADIILSSPAIRARETAELVAEQMKYDTSQIKYESDIYNGSARSLLELINQTSEDCGKMVIVGHNPAIAYLAEYLTKADIGSLEACGYAFIRVEGNWESVSEGSCILEYCQSPSQIRENS